MVRALVNEAKVQLLWATYFFCLHCISSSINVVHSAKTARPSADHARALNSLKFFQTEKITGTSAFSVFLIISNVISTKYLLQTNEYNAPAFSQALSSWT